ncbi:hypothetical protein CEXT_336811 [Caerostris extrusa]|uniref:Uncharacterized protein n=1 Tax=Caerostris extrusa TaxID=172846 RepID=A0AAV4VFY4_CAEEX|nr:hypothetical protein CEXT_336811 [Caerostris extrusa]
MALTAKTSIFCLNFLKYTPFAVNGVSRQNSWWSHVEMGPPDRALNLRCVFLGWFFWRGGAPAGMISDYFI